MFSQVCIIPSVHGGRGCASGGGVCLGGLSGGSAGGEVCQGGLPRGGLHPRRGLHRGGGLHPGRVGQTPLYNEIRSTSGWYALLECILVFRLTDMGCLLACQDDGY